MKSVPRRRVRRLAVSCHRRRHVDQRRRAVAPRGKTRRRPASGLRARSSSRDHPVGRLPKRRSQSPRRACRRKGGLENAAMGRGHPSDLECHGLTTRRRGFCGPLARRVAQRQWSTCHHVFRGLLKGHAISPGVGAVGCGACQLPAPGSIHGRSRVTRRHCRHCPSCSCSVCDPASLASVEWCAAEEEPRRSATRRRTTASLNPLSELE